ncbi:Similar to hypothetical protein [Botryotinia fuckeliana]; acc. no. CCD54735 [Pyronema omphalodes CBS 100304]|uniref:Uncharacterized protein n=1 Tax=Pyronema omphalodes (strain CBS 100304) TaxID=1076935 RepID=U4LQS7_PYROM|nr:Similar to hypothetical protein [Botryotinia fuckeliana]; acc. no. CCD54735 [Pyronema omphalodes CBS 100304]
MCLCSLGGGGGNYGGVFATIVRLFSVNAINAYITSWALTLIGENDSRMLFPAWIFVASIDHLPQQCH